MAFVHLTTRTSYSFLEGFTTPQSLAKLAAQHHMSAVALTDASNVCGCVDFQKACAKESVKPIFGAFVWIEPDRATEESPVLTLGFDSPPSGLPTEHYEGRGWAMTLLAEDRSGYQRLCELLSMAHRQMFFAPRVSLDALLDRPEGLIGLVGGATSFIGRLDPDRQHEILERMAGRMGPDRLYLTLSDHGIPGELHRNQITRAFARSYGLSTVVTQDVLYDGPEDSPMLDVLYSIASGHSLSSEGLPGLETDQCYFKSEEEMASVFSGDLESLHRSGEIADRCSVQLELGKVYLPVSHPPAEASTEERWAWLRSWLPTPSAWKSASSDIPEEARAAGDDASLLVAYFRWYCRSGLQHRLDTEPSTASYGSKKDYFDRLDYEMSVIIDKGYPTYMLIVSEFINWAKDQGITVGPGRGSGAGAVVAWAMSITDLNPIQFGLFFERFLNPERESMPDIDVDFPQRHRERVIAHVRDRYGEDRVGQILTLLRFKPKNAIGDVARACQISFKQRLSWTELFDEAKSIEAGIGQQEAIRQHRDGNPAFRRVLALGQRIEGRPRNPGVHAGGVIIASKPLSDFAPMHFDAKQGRTFVGVDMRAAEDLGLVKFDFLGVKTLDVLDEALDNVEARHGHRPDLLKIPLDDPKVFELLSDGDGLGLFQVESFGMRQLLRQMQPSHIEDLIALCALYRPGPMQSGMHETYVECKHGRKPIVYPHPLLEDVLGTTYGVIVYQEQVMSAAQVMAGYSLGEADMLRRAMGKKKPEVMRAQRERFVEGSVRNGIDRTKAGEVFDLIDYFSGYGFNKSHSAAYGLISYQTAWMKAHYRIEHMASVMTWECEARDKLVSYIFDCRRVGIEILGPDIHASGRSFQVEGSSAIRYGLVGIKGLGDAAIEALLEERAKGPFQSLQDVLVRLTGTAVNKSAFRALSAAGAFDSFGVGRHEMYRLTEKVDKPKKNQSVFQLGLFGSSSAPTETRESTEDLLASSDKVDWTKPWHPNHQLDKEYGVLGFWITGSPLDRWADIEERVRTVTTLDLAQCPPKQSVTLVGLVGRIHRIKDRQEREMTYVTIIDRLGQDEVVIFPSVYKQYKRLIQMNSPLVVVGHLERKGGKLIVSRLSDLASVRKDQATTIDLWLTEDQICVETLRSIRQISERMQGDAPLRLACRTDSGVAWFETDLSIRPVQDWFDAVETLLGVPGVAGLPTQRT